LAKIAHLTQEAQLPSQEHCKEMRRRPASSIQLERQQNSGRSMWGAAAPKVGFESPLGRQQRWFSSVVCRWLFVVFLDPNRYKVPIYTIQLLLQTRKHLLLQEQRIEQCFLNKSGFGFLKEENIKILVQMQDN
jgi:hypothetical protein